MAAWAGIKGDGKRIDLGLGASPPPTRHTPCLVPKGLPRSQEFRYIPLLGPNPNLQRDDGTVILVGGCGPLPMSPPPIPPRPSLNGTNGSQQGSPCAMANTSGNAANLSRTMGNTSGNFSGRAPDAGIRPNVTPSLAMLNNNAFSNAIVPLIQERIQNVTDRNFKMSFEAKITYLITNRLNEIMPNIFDELFRNNEIPLPQSCTCPGPSPGDTSTFNFRYGQNELPEVRNFVPSPNRRNVMPDTNWHSTPGRPQQPLQNLDESFGCVSFPRPIAPPPSENTSSGSSSSNEPTCSSWNSSDDAAVNNYTGSSRNTTNGPNETCNGPEIVPINPQGNIPNNLQQDMQIFKPANNVPNNPQRDPLIGPQRDIYNRLQQDSIGSGPSQRNTSYNSSLNDSVCHCSSGGSSSIGSQDQATRQPCAILNIFLSCNGENNDGSTNDGINIRPGTNGVLVERCPCKKN